MKRHLYSLCFVIATIGFSACSKSNDPAPVSPVVGKWSLNQGLLSGFAAPNTDLNGIGLDLYYLDSYGSTIDIYSDNTFNANYRRVTVGDASGTWSLANDKLTLNYDDGDQENYTYTKTKNVEQLASSAPTSFTLPVSTTATAAGQISLVYRK